ncbi:unnamed protein product [Nezara viridula]|uniref:Uncharacterized protein n=1 Tax=Nezara viridula TaxID=85310 RepID=A0A9P0DYZ7_NEZVI|nr:unnamed protein product [Nezara viridula]
MVKHGLPSARTDTATHGRAASSAKDLIQECQRHKHPLCNPGRLTPALLYMVSFPLEYHPISSPRVLTDVRSEALQGRMERSVNEKDSAGAVGCEREQKGNERKKRLFRYAPVATPMFFPPPSSRLSFMEGNFLGVFHFQPGVDIFVTPHLFFSPSLQRAGNYASVC